MVNYIWLFLYVKDYADRQRIKRKACGSSCASPGLPLYIAVATKEAETHLPPSTWTKRVANLRISPFPRDEPSSDVFWPVKNLWSHCQVSGEPGSVYMFSQSCFVEDNKETTCQFQARQHGRTGRGLRKGILWENAILPTALGTFIVAGHSIFRPHSARR